MADCRPKAAQNHCTSFCNWIITSWLIKCIERHNFYEWWGGGAQKSASPGLANSAVPGLPVPRVSQGRPLTRAQIWVFHSVNASQKKKKTQKKPKKTRMNTLERLHLRLQLKKASENTILVPLLFRLCFASISVISDSR